MTLLDRAIQLAADVHAGQKDRSGLPYILHPLRVMLAGRTEEERIVGVLHDVVEDTDLTLRDLRDRGFPDEIVDAVDALSRREGEDYMEFVRRAATNPLARTVKLYDLSDNLDATRLTEFGRADAERMNRYLKARTYLLSLVGEK